LSRCLLHPDPAAKQVVPEGLRLLGPFVTREHQMVVSRHPRPVRARGDDGRLFDETGYCADTAARDFVQARDDVRI
jgi:hypothetical protein